MGSALAWVLPSRFFLGSNRGLLAGRAARMGRAGEPQNRARGNQRNQSRFDPDLPFDRQPRPGSAQFGIVTGKTKDFTVIFNDFNGFSIDRDYGPRSHDLCALLA